jgi:hypothetical protein
MKKRRHHYIWKKYLKSWTEDNKIWCYRDGDVFNTNLDNVGVKKDFYRFGELSESDCVVIYKLGIEKTQEHLKKLNLRWLNSFYMVSGLMETVKEENPDNKKIKDGMDQIKQNLEENMYANIEQASKEYLDSLLRRDLDFYKNDDKCIDFCYFISSQLFRTKNIQISTKNALEKAKKIFQDINVETIWQVLRHIFSTNVGWVLFASRDVYGIWLLKNNTSLELITGDQPVINLKASGDNNNLEPPEDFELYYPISPDYAIKISEDGDLTNRDKLSKIQINYLNQKIIDHAHKQVYASSKEVLKDNNLI